MSYRIFHPHPALNQIVEYYWYAKIELNGAVQQHYATPLLQGLAFNFKKQQESHAYNDKVLTLYKQAYFFGQPISPRVITTNEKGVDILGVKCTPLGIARITGIHMEHLSDQIIAAEDIWGNELESLCDAMQSNTSLEQSLCVLEHFLMNKLTGTSTHYRVNHVQHAIDLINRSNGTIDIKTLQSQTNTSRKTLERAFLHYLGLMPKFYAEIVRFNATKNLMDRNPCQPIVNIALDMGYYDNSHLAGTFKRFSGLTPTAYLKNVRAARLGNTHFRENGAVSFS